MTEEQEIFVLDIFKERYLEFPSGTIERKKPPLPDFLLITNNGEQIGIEVTEAVISEDEFKHLSFTYKITDLVLEKLKGLLPFSFEITVKTYKNVKLNKSDIKKIVDDLVNLCLNECLVLNNFEKFRAENFEKDITTYPLSIQSWILKDGFRNLPKGIKSIKLGRYDSAGKSWNSKSGGMVVPHFTDQSLNKVLQKKETKKYGKCDKYWLVIWESGGITSYYHDIKVETPIKSKFDKVFLARTYIPEIVVLK